MLYSLPISVLQTCFCVLLTHLQHAYACAASEKLYPRSFCFCLPMCHECTRFQQSCYVVMFFQRCSIKHWAQTVSPNMSRLCTFRSRCLAEASRCAFAVVFVGAAKQDATTHRSALSCNGEETATGAIAGDERAQHANLPYHAWQAVKSLA